MEGTLLKWTNYWNGWQPRWFVLKEGVLFYYNSQNDTNSGCKRSFKISMFDIIVNRTDSTRMDLIVANDQHLYLKACDYRERQKWLVAIATQKASYPNSTNEQQYIYESNNLLKCKQSELRLYCDLLMQQIHEMKDLVNTEKLPTNEAKKIDEITSNVNVTCEMLMNIVKNIIIIFENQNQHQLANINGVLFNNQHQHHNNNNNHHHQHNLLLNNNSNLSSLKEILNENLLTLNLNNNNNQSTSTPNTLTPPPSSSSSIDNDTSTNNLSKSYTNTTTNNHHHHHLNEKERLNGSSALINNLLSHNIHITNSKLLNDNNNIDINNNNNNNNLKSNHKRALSSTSSVSSTYSNNSKATSFATVESGNLLLNIKNTNIEINSVEEDILSENKMKKSSDHHNNRHGHHQHSHHHHHGHHEITHSSFFISLNHRFENFQFIDNDQIPTEEFLSCCRDIFKILDIFGSTTFLPVKIDVTGNMNKLAQKFSTNEKKYHTLQAIVQSELDENVTTVKNSATDALLWLKRAIWFLREFFYNFVKPNSDLSDCIQKSYTKTLKKYHNWVVRGIFSLALRSVPTKDSFFLALSIDQSEFYNHPVEFEKAIIKDIKNMLINVDKILNTLNTFYTTNKLDENNPILDD